MVQEAHLLTAEEIQRANETRKAVRSMPHWKG
jgi:hypothetical protein